MASIGEKMTSYQYNLANIDKVIFGVGAFENHGYHMPFGTDTLISNGLAERVAERVNGLMVLPPIAYGLSAHYNKLPFVVSLQPETVTSIIKELLQEVIRNGIKKIIIIN